MLRDCSVMVTHHGIVVRGHGGIVSPSREIRIERMNYDIDIDNGASDLIGALATALEYGNHGVAISLESTPTDGKFIVRVNDGPIVAGVTLTEKG